MNARFDTSALVKLYIKEEGTDRAIEAVPATDRSRVVILDLTPLEARSAIRRRQRERRISTVRETVSPSWQASAWLLERKFPEEFARKVIEHWGLDSNPSSAVTLVFDDGKSEDLAEAEKKARK